MGSGINSLALCFLISIGVGFLALLSLQAVPLSFQYQGHLTVDGVAPDGEGYFKFALLDGEGEIVWSNAEVDDGDEEPSLSVPLDLVRGVYSVSIGDEAFENMATIDSALLDNETLSLRVWFSRDDILFEPLAPDASITSLPFAARAARADHAEVAGTVLSLPTDLIEPRHFAGDTMALLTTFSELANRMMAVSVDPEDAILTAAGYRPIRALEQHSWVAGAGTAEPARRVGHTGVWTGTEYLVWGGYGGRNRYLNSGGAYDREIDSWSALSPIDSPEARRDATSVWTGQEMIVWGGRSGAGYLNSGGRYDASSKDWIPISESAAPDGRSGHVSEWTGSVMAVWGGRSSEGLPEAGGVYDPATDSWQSFQLSDLRPGDSFEVTLRVELEDANEGGNAPNWSDGIDEDPPFFRGINSVLVSGDLAFVTASSDDSLTILDVSDPSSPDILSSVLHVSGQSGGPDEVDSEIFVIDELNLPTSPFVKDNYLYVSSPPSSTLSVFDISDPTDIERVELIGESSSGNLSLFERPRQIGVSGNRMVVALEGRDGAETSGLYFFRVADPSSPAYRARVMDGDTIPTISGGTATIDFGVGLVWIAIDGSTVIAGGEEEPALYIISTSTLREPTLVTKMTDNEGGFDYLSSPRSPAFNEDGTILAVGSDGDEDAVTLIDVSDRSDPKLLSVIVDGVGGFDYLDRPDAIAIENGVMAIASYNDDAVTLVDIRVPSDPVLIAQFQHNGGFLSALDVARAITIQDGLVYIGSAASGTSALTILELTEGTREPREGATSVWTGEQMVVWGGRTDSGETADGFLLDFDASATPIQWTGTDDEGAPTARTGHTAIWTGSEMIIWGGVAGGMPFDDGARLDLATGEWLAMATEGAPSGRSDHAAVWTGSELLILGGRDRRTWRSDAYAYDPATDRWRALSVGGSPIARSDLNAVWTGDEVLVFGGRSDGGVIGALERLNPDPPLLLFHRQ